MRETATTRRPTGWPARVVELAVMGCSLALFVACAAVAVAAVVWAVRVVSP